MSIGEEEEAPRFQKSKADDGFYFGTVISRFDYPAEGETRASIVVTTTRGEPTSPVEEAPGAGALLWL